MRRMILAAALLIAGAGTALAQAPAAPAALAPAPLRPVAMTLSSPDFQDGGIIPDDFTAKVNVQGQPPKAPSPALNWTGAPAGTVSYVMIMHDLDVMLGRSINDNLHWLAFNIPGNLTGLPRGVPNLAQLPDGTIQPRNRNINGYAGPGAPAPIYHHYVFSIWALDTRLNLTDTATRAEVLAAMDGHVLDKGFLVGRFHR